MDITYWWTADDGTPEGTLAHYAAVQGWVPVLSSMATLVAEKRKNDVLSPQYAVMSSVPADVNPLTAKNTYDYRTPLLSACKGGHVDALEFLLNKTMTNGHEKKKKRQSTESNGNNGQADELEDKVNMNEAGMTCAHIAARENRANVLTFLANRQMKEGSKHGVFRGESFPTVIYSIRCCCSCGSHYTNNYHNNNNHNTIISLCVSVRCELKFQIA